MAAPLKSFAAAYQLVPSEHRHAYDIVEGACHLFFDLEYTGVHLAHGDEMAQQVAAAARETVAELAAAQHYHVRIDTVAFDSAHNDKFSRHLLLMMSTEHGAPVLLRGPCEAGAVAARVAERVGREGAALVIDRSVYAPGRASLRNIRFQISDFRFQISDPDTQTDSFREISDFRFEIAAGHKGKHTEGKQNSLQALLQISAQRRRSQITQITSHARSARDEQKSGAAIGIWRVSDS